MHFDVETPEPHRTGHRWVDFVIAGSALMVSVVSLAVAIGHGRTMERMAQANDRMVEAASWPFVSLHLSRDDHAIEIGVRNAGLGPAKVRWVQVLVDGVPVRNGKALLARCCGLQPGQVVDYAFSVATGTVVRAGDEVDLITMRNEPQNAAIYPRLSAAAHRLSVHSCYCSVFDECYVSDGDTLDTRHVAHCAAPATPFQDNALKP